MIGLSTALTTPKMAATASSVSTRSVVVPAVSSMPSRSISATHRATAEMTSLIRIFIPRNLPAPAAPGEPERCSDRAQSPPKGGPRARPPRALQSKPPDHGEGLGGGEDVLGDGADVVEGDGVDAGQDFVDGEERLVHEFAFADAAHAGAGVFEAEDHRAAELAFSAFEFFVGEAFVGGSGDLVAADREDFVGFGVLAAGVDAEDAGVGVLGGVAVDGVGEAAFLADLLEEAGRHAAAERGVEHAEREAAF